MDLRILSAGYGLIAEERVICPYNVTFHGMEKPRIRALARHLDVPEDVRAAVGDVELVIFLLGTDYLHAIDPPIAARFGQRLVFLAKPSESYRLASTGVVTVPAGSSATKYGAGYVALKGKMFELFAEALARRPELFDEIKADPSPAAFLNALDA